LELYFQKFPQDRKNQPELYILNHLQNKLATRDVKQYLLNQELDTVPTASMFNLVEGPIESWEVIK
jgi:hypothetical protein